MSIIKKVNSLLESSLSLTEHKIQDSLLKKINYECKEIPIGEEPELLVSRNTDYFKKQNVNVFNEITSDCKPLTYAEEPVNKYDRLVVTRKNLEESSSEDEDIDKMIQQISNEIKSQSIKIQKINAAKLALSGTLTGDNRQLDVADIRLLDLCNKLIIDHFSKAKLPENANIDI